MTQLSLEVYCIDMKYIRNLHKIDFKKIISDIQKNILCTDRYFYCRICAKKKVIVSWI